MTQEAHDLLDAALRLPPKQRAEVIIKLLASLLASLKGKVNNDVEAAWAVEIEHRARRVLEGEGEFEDWEGIRDELRPNS